MESLSVSPAHGIPATEPAVIEWQVLFVDMHHLPKFSDKKPKATTKVTLMSHKTFNYLCDEYDMFTAEFLLQFSD